MADKRKIRPLGFPVSVEFSAGKKINVRKLLAGKGWQVPLEFDALVDFADLFVKLGMRGKHVSQEKQWSFKNPPPEGIKVLEFENKAVAQDVEAISRIAQVANFYKNARLTGKYYLLTKRVFSEISRGSKACKESPFLGLIRAGVVAGEMLGISWDKQILVQTKRLPLPKGKIAVGLSYLTPISKNFTNLLIADPAGATYSSIVANLLYLKLRGCLPGKVEIWNVSGSHKGCLFARDVMRQLGIDGRIIVGGYSPGMNEKYYLERYGGQPSVGDAGDALNRFLPKRLKIGVGKHE